MIKQVKFFKKQGEALKLLLNDFTNEILYGGGARGGKSWLGCFWVIMIMLSKDGSAFLVIRKDHRRLIDTTLVTFMKVLKWCGVNDRFKYNAQRSIFTCDNGSVCYFREGKYLPQDPEYDRFGSYDLTGAFIDEAQEIRKKLIDVLRGRFSLLKGEGWTAIPKMFLSCNPSKGFIYTDFYKPHKEGILEKEKAFVKALATDNPYVSQAYIDNLKRSDKITVQRLLYGNFEYDDNPNALMDYDSICDLFTNTHIERTGKRYITADIAMKGSDLFVIFVWDGFVLIDFYAIPKSGGKEIIDKINEFRRKYQIGESHVVYDSDGVGAFIGGEGGFLRYAKPFVNNGRPLENKGEKENYENLKTQCTYKMAERVVSSGYDLSLFEAQKEALIEELEVISTRDADKDGKLKVTRKEQVKELIGRSPDFKDALMMREYFELDYQEKQLPQFA